MTSLEMQLRASIQLESMRRALNLALEQRPSKALFCAPNT